MDRKSNLFSRVSAISIETNLVYCFKTFFFSSSFFHLFSACVCILRFVSFLYVLCTRLKFGLAGIMLTNLIRWCKPLDSFVCRRHRRKKMKHLCLYIYVCCMYMCVCMRMIVKGLCKSWHKYFMLYIICNLFSTDF